MCKSFEVHLFLDYLLVKWVGHSHDLTPTPSNIKDVLLPLIKKINEQCVLL